MGGLRVGLWGAEGRMGRAVRDAAQAAGDVTVVAAPPPEADPAEAFGEADVVVDFTRPEGTARVAAACVVLRRPLVSGTTGLDAPALAALDALAAVAPVVHAPNMSQGVTVLFHLAALAAEWLGEAFDAEVVEMHHRGKADAPSGTAWRLGEALARAKGLDPATALRTARQGFVGARPDAEVGVVALRGGSVIGDHTAVLAGPGERLELVHRAEDRSLFARGALRAARWAVAQRPGRYGMGDVLGLGRSG